MEWVNVDRKWRSVGVGDHRVVEGARVGCVCGLLERILEVPHILIGDIARK